MNTPIRSISVDVDRKTRLAVRAYRFFNITLFYLGQPLTAVASILGPIVIKRHEAAGQWAFLLASGALTFAFVYLMTRIGKNRARAYLVARGHFNLAEGCPTV